MRHDAVIKGEGEVTVAGSGVPKIAGTSRRGSSSVAVAHAHDKSWFTLPSDYLSSIFGPSTPEDYVKNVDEADSEGEVTADEGSDVTSEVSDVDEDTPNLRSGNG